MHVIDIRVAIGCVHVYTSRKYGTFHWNPVTKSGLNTGSG